MFRKHSWGNVSISQGDRTKAQQTDKTFLRTDFSDFFFFFYSLCSIPRIWPGCTELCVSCGAESEQGLQSPEVSSNLTRRVSQQHTKGKGSTLTLPPFSSRSLVVSSSPLLSCDLCGGHWENRHYMQLAVRYLKAYWVAEVTAPDFSQVYFYTAISSLRYESTNRKQ